MVDLLTEHIAYCPALWCELLLFHSRGRRWFIHRRFIPWPPAPGSMLTGGLCGPCPGHSSAARPPVTFHYGRAGPQSMLSSENVLPAARPCVCHIFWVYLNPVHIGRASSASDHDCTALGLVTGSGCLCSRVTYGHSTRAASVVAPLHNNHYPPGSALENACSAQPVMEYYVNFAL